jgi:zinc transport system substrate-binding protein
MQLIATYISNIIIELDPKNEHIYAENLKEVNLELDELKEQLKQQLAPFSSIPFAIYSDTLQYFEKSLELQRPVIITPFHGAGLSIKRTLDAKRKIKDLNISCLIYDTEVKAKQLRVLSEGLNLKSFKIDILGNEFAPGPDQYFNLMKKTSSQLALCLK